MSKLKWYDTLAVDWLMTMITYLVARLLGYSGAIWFIVFLAVLAGFALSIVIINRLKFYKLIKPK